MKSREEKIRLWFDMWLRQTDLGITELFAGDAVYIESWGHRYEGAEKIRHWFQEWNRRGRVLVWDIKQYIHTEDQTAVEWYFQNRMNNGKEERFEGISLVTWTGDGKVGRLQEFGCNVDQYDPYQNGETPCFRAESSPWF